MKYLCSKRRIAKYIVPILEKHRKPNQLYVEPFVGGANMIEHMSNQRIGFDVNKYVIALLNCIRDNPESLPCDNTILTEEKYKYLSKNYELLPSEMNALVGFAAIPVSFGGKWFGGWPRSMNNNGPRDHVKESFNNAQKQSSRLQGAKFKTRSFLDLKLRRKSLIYCDPPYHGTTKYVTDFDHDIFFDWCRLQHSEGHTVFVSEYNAPDDFDIVLEMESKVNFASTCKQSDKRTERLFTLK